MRNPVLLFIVFLLTIASETAATNYYVSAAGNNAGNGLTPATAWQTISKVNAAFATMAAGDSILFRRGDTFYGAIIVNKSGASSRPIVISAYGTGNKPVISGFVRASAWVSVGNGIYQCQLSGAKSSLNMVTLNNVPQALGRYPNAEDPNGGYLKYESFSGAVSITDNELTSATNWTGAEVVVRKKLWVLDRCKITSHTGSTLTFTNTNSSTYEGTNNYGYFFQNDPRTLDQFGEWYYNHSTRNLQMYFGSAIPSSYAVQASVIDTLLIITSKSYVNINNLAFDGANGDAIFSSSSSFINIQNCDFTNAGESAIDMQNVSNLLVENCSTNHVLSNAIMLMNVRASNAVIRGCAVKNTGVLPGMGLSNGNSYKGIYANVQNNLLVEYNRVDTAGYVGIEFQGSNVTVKNNVVNYFDFVKDDAGGIYSYASGTDADPGPSYNNRVVKDNIVMNGVGAPEGRFSSSLFVSGIYLDGRTMNVDLLNNTVFNNGKNGIHCNNPNNVNIKGNTSYNNLNAMSMMRWAWGGINGLSIKNNIFYPKTESQRSFYYSNSGLNEPVTTTVQSTLQNLGSIDSNYYNMANPVGLNFEIYASTGGALIPTSPLSLEGWRSFSGHDNNSKKPAKVPVSYKLNNLVGANKFTNGAFALNIQGITLFGTSVTSAWDNTSKISGGSLRLNFTSPVANRYALLHSPIGAVSSAKKYVLRFSTYGTTQQGIVKAYLRKTIAPYTALLPVQFKSFGLGRSDHEFLLLPSLTDAGASFVIEIEQNSGTTYIDNVEFYEANAIVYNTDAQLRFEYNDTKEAKTIPLDALYTAVNGTNYNNGTLTLQPYSSIILVRDTSSRVPLAVTATPSVIKCYGDSAIVTVSATGGTAPYTGTGTFIVKAGLFNFTVTDATGATATATITITQPSAVLQVSAAAPNITVAGGTTTVTVTATGGITPYTGTGTFTGVAAGSYTYVVSDANGCSASSTITITQPSTTYTLTRVSTPAAGGSISSSPNTTTYAAGTVVTLTATPAAGYVFTGWSGAASGTAASVTVTMDANKTVTANFQTAVIYTLTTLATPTPGGWVARNPNAVSYPAGTVVTLTVNPNTGYIFTGWSGAASGTSTSVSITMDGNKTVTANFQAITTTTYTLSTPTAPSAGGTVTRSLNLSAYSAGSVVTLTANPAAGYVFTGWSGSASGTSPSVSVTMDANKTVTANFQALTYTLTTTATPTAGGSVSRTPNTASYSYGTVVTLTATPAAGYVFTGWSGAATGTSTSVSVTMDASKTVTANFQATVMYSLTTLATPVPGGWVSRSPNAVSYPAGTVVTLTVNPNTGYAFTGWSGAASGTAASVTVTMDANKTVTVNFQAITATSYTLTTPVAPSVGGSVSRSINAISYSSGTMVTLTANPAEGYMFTGWSGDAAGTEPSVAVLMNANKMVTANFEPLIFTLTTSATPSAGGVITSDLNETSHTLGTVVTLTAIPAPGYLFTGWSGDVTGTQPSVNITMDNNKAVTANFQAITYTLNTAAAPAAGGVVSRSVNAGSYAYGSVVTLTATPASGYQFTGWSGDVAGTASSVAVTMDGNKTATANFQPIVMYALTTLAIPVPGGWVSRSPNAVTYPAGTVVTLTVNTHPGYLFTGWTGAASGTSTSVMITMDGNKTATVNFQAITATTYTLNTASLPVAGGSVTRSLNAATYNSGAVVTLTATPSPGYVFTNWSGDASGTTASVAVTMNSNKTVTANFQPITYSLATTASPAAGGSVSRSINAASYNSGTVLTLTAAPASGYAFTGWSGDVSGTSASVNVTMDGNKTITANFEPIIYYTLITLANPTPGGWVARSPNAVTYPAGTVVTLTVNPVNGYVFTGWSGGASGSATSVTVTMDGNKTVTANFQLPSSTYTLTTAAAPTAGGSVSRSINAASYNSGTVVTLTATPAAGYVFTGWSGGATGTASYVAVTMDANKTVTANFEAITYTLTTAAAPTAGGSVSRSINAASYNSGTVVTLTATPAAGYSFTGWSGSATGTASSVAVTMDANKTVTANFEAITYTLTTAAAPTAGGSVSRSINAASYNSGTVVTLTATPAAGYVFTGWSGSATGTASSVAVTMDANKTVTANFQPITYYTLITLANPTAGGWVARSPNAVTYPAGTVVALTVNPVNGYVFTGWSGDASGSATTVTVTMDGNKTVTANFQLPVNYTLSTTASPTAGGSVSRSFNAANYSAGTVVTLTANPAVGYVFTGWSGDAGGTEPSVAVTMNSNKTVTANFAIQSTTLRILENATPTGGLCSYEGVLSSNSGATNTRVINLTNSANRGINWSINAAATGTYTLNWRYVNSSSSNSFVMRLIVNGIIVNSAVPFPRTSGSSIFLNTSIAVSLTAGNNIIRLESVTSGASADIDWLEVTGNNPTPGNCSPDAVSSRPSPAASTITATAEQKTGVYPNPASDKINIGFYVPETERVSIVILDEAGNTVSKTASKLYPAGYNIHTYDVSGKLPGIYIVLVTGERTVKHAFKLVVVH
jgi:uncharacterized repeat protein (TIGR02543 family)